MSQESEELNESIRAAFGDNDLNGINVPEAIKDAFRRDDDHGFTSIVDVVELLAENAKSIANAITPTNAAMAPCPSGDGQVGSLTEAVMGLTRSMMHIASAIQSVADAIEDK